MSCRIVQNSLSDHIDGCLSAEERQGVIEHLAACPECTIKLRQMVQIRKAVRRLPKAMPPAHLTSMLRVTASKERNRRLAWNHPFDHFAQRLQLWIDNLMRPLALPFAGGLVSAILLFGMLTPGFSVRSDSSYDVPLDYLFTEPAVKAQSTLGISASDDIEVEVVTDVHGRAVDYSIKRGPAEPEVRREIENKLLFMEFKPATAFGMPTFGKIRLQFSQTQVNVQS